MKSISGVDAAIMLDHIGFVSELNDANLFMIKQGIVYAPVANACTRGTTRGVVADTCPVLSIPPAKNNLSLTASYGGDAVFVTGTLDEITPVKEMNGKRIINRSSCNKPEKIINRFHNLIDQYSENQTNYGKDI